MENAVFEEMIPMDPIQVSERVLKVANLVSRFTQNEMAQLLDLVPALQEVRPASAQVEDDKSLPTSGNWQWRCPVVPRLLRRMSSYSV